DSTGGNGLASDRSGDRVAHLLSLDGQWLLRGMLSSDAMACLAGRSSRCIAALAAPPRGPDSLWYARVISRSAFDLYGVGSRWNRPALGSAEPALLSDMVRSMGVQRFQRFWSSPLPPSQAFVAASGEPLDAWTAAWMHAHYGHEQVGATVAGRGLAAGLGSLAAAFGLAVLVAHRRRYLS
ncbi:MAG TPA: hypothetical protein VIC55_03300, partial [Gemmatimonadaceae bacterium]